MTRHIVTDPSEITDVLSSSAVAPPSRDGAGATLSLRNAMARFAGPDDHPARRPAVVDAAAMADAAVVAEIASSLTVALLDDGEARVDAIELAHEVSVVALAAGLALIDPYDRATAHTVVADIEAVVAVIGRGESPTPASDAATERLLALATDHPIGPVPVVSLLYQSYDATAALIATTLHADTTGRRRSAAVPRTVRVALVDATLAGHRARAGDDFALEIGGACMEFGFGPHACPGESIARAITESVVDAVTSSGYSVDLDSVMLDDDGRPTSMSLKA